MSLLRSDTTAALVTTSDGRDDALQVLDDIYGAEKRWVDDAASLFPASDLGDDRISWVLARVDGAPAGVLRVHYDPPLELYAEYGLQPVDGNGALPSNLDIDTFIRTHRIAEIGRFAVRPTYRRRIRVVFWLMRVAWADTLDREYSHYVTDVFEDEPHSPYDFHTRVLGFQPIATHATGEMNCLRRRITLILNLQAAYHRLHASKNRLYRFLTAGLDDSLQHRLAMSPAPADPVLG